MNNKKRDRILESLENYKAKYSRFCVAVENILCHSFGAAREDAAELGQALYEITTNSLTEAILDLQNMPAAAMDPPKTIEDLGTIEVQMQLLQEQIDRMEGLPDSPETAMFTIAVSPLIQILRQQLARLVSERDQIAREIEEQEHAR